MHTHCLTGGSPGPSYALVLKILHQLGPLVLVSPALSLGNSTYTPFENGIHTPMGGICKKAFALFIFCGIHLMEGNTNTSVNEMVGNAGDYGIPSPS